MTKVVYIVGSSYSGSTLLGLLLGKNLNFFNAGELKALDRIDAGEESCSCGNQIAGCAFWSKLMPLARGTTSRPGAADWLSTVAALLSFPRPPNRPNGADSILIRALRERVFDEDEHGIVVDVSKSLWRLNALLRDPELDIQAVWIRKSLPACIASLTKRGRGFWTALAQATLTDWVNRRYLRSRCPGYVTVWYEELATNPENVLNELCGRLVPAHRAADRGPRANEDLHLATGNEGTKRGLQGDREFTVRLDPAWLRRLSPAQQWIATKLARRARHPIEAYAAHE